MRDQLALVNADLPVPARLAIHAGGRAGQWRRHLLPVAQRRAVAGVGRNILALALTRRVDRLQVGVEDVDAVGHDMLQVDLAAMFHCARRAVPAEGNVPDLHLLGSSGYSAKLAGLLGLPFAFAHHFSSQNTVPALELYRSSFRPSERLDAPYAIVCVAVVCADTDEQAQWLAGSDHVWHPWDLFHGGTYAYFDLTQNINGRIRSFPGRYSTDVLAEQTRSVRIPLNQNSQLIRLARAETVLAQVLKRDPTEAELGRLLDEKAAGGAVLFASHHPGLIDAVADARCEPGADAR